MATDIIDFDDLEGTGMNILLKRFWGGVDRGTCYSLMLKNSLKDNIELSDKEFMFMVYRKFKLDFDEVQDKDTLYTGHIRYIEVVGPFLDYVKKRYGFLDKDEVCAHE